MYMYVGHQRSRTMKVVAPSLCFLAGAGLASSFIAPSIPVTSRANASPRRASQRDTVVASGEHFEVRVRRSTPTGILVNLWYIEPEGTSRKWLQLVLIADRLGMLTHL